MAVFSPNDPYFGSTPKDSLDQDRAVWFFRRELAFRAFYAAITIIFMVLIAAVSADAVAKRLDTFQSFLSMGVTGLLALSGAYMGLATWSSMKSGNGGVQFQSDPSLSPGRKKVEVEEETVEVDGDSVRRRRKTSKTDSPSEPSDDEGDRPTTSKDTAVKPDVPEDDDEEDDRPDKKSKG